ncbi:glucose-6-phosphate dehydrogenase assembly protein OpcA [Streptacidiphilus sp. N1-10]|uniref:Glucose-6-phosphate dehydrogenase assembly protein OpcA n=1 Tax=Streptacidiphilus jeojiensis TaxID=3229225 RepID=A0ABV6XRV0_9ACTN
MKIDLTDTTSSKINSGLVEARRAIGGLPAGSVLTLIVVADEEGAYDAVQTAAWATRQHSSRILVVIRRTDRGPRSAGTRLDAEIRVGSDAGTGETVLLRLHGELASQAQSVVLPLLLPDAPVVVWWPENAPENAAKDPLGALAQRRITDGRSAENPLAELGVRAASYTPGDTDLAWTRITPWRSVLAAALDQVGHSAVVSAAVGAPADDPSAELLTRWLAGRLEVRVERIAAEGACISSVELVTADGAIRLGSPQNGTATLAITGLPDRQVRLGEREDSELLAEELRRLDRDDSYADALVVGRDQERSSHV